MPVQYIPHPIRAVHQQQAFVAGVWVLNNSLRPVMFMNDLNCSIAAVADWAWFQTNIRANPLAPIMITSAGGWNNPPQGAAPLTAYFTAILLVPPGWQYQLITNMGGAGFVAFGPFERWDL